METVFIADDEQVIRDGLKQIIDWESFGFTVCGDAANGEEALAKILELNPSLVLIDIRMPKMHGIDVIEAARAKGFNGKIIIISGYSDFKYAQAAIRQGVGYYLTKPVDEDELTSIINEIHTNIIDEHKTSQVLHHYREEAKKEILDELVTGNADIDLINTEEMNLCADVYKVVIYEQYLRDADSMPYQFSELLRVTNNGSFTFEHFCKNDKNVIILKGTYALDKFQRFWIITMQFHRRTALLIPFSWHSGVQLTTCRISPYHIHRLNGLSADVSSANRASTRSVTMPCLISEFVTSHLPTK